MKEPMLQAKYPITNSKEFVEIIIGKPEIDPHLPYKDYFCSCKITAPNYKKELDVYGIDELQCVWLALRQIRVEIAEFEKNLNMKCEYCYFQDFET